MHTPENLGDLIDAARDPHKLALVALGDLDETEDGWRDTRITYGELDALADGVASRFSPPIARSTWRPCSASCARGLSRRPSTSGFRKRCRPS
jgi:hypothetical protein